ncbi:MAG: hypothetical protein SPL23_06925 [Lachnospiraceae bacterium]|nr:hypothetical protein [Lachnospiraceae bacterium]
MNNYGYDYDSEMEYDGMYGEETEHDEKTKRPMLENVISILQALINILDIIGENLGKRK